MFNPLPDERLSRTFKRSIRNSALMRAQQLNTSSCSAGYRILNTNSCATKKKREYLQSVVDEIVPLPTKNDELTHYLMAIRGMDAEQIIVHKAYILNLLYEIYTTYFNSILYASIKPEFRYTLCWVDEASYIQTLTEKG